MAIQTETLESFLGLPFKFTSMLVGMGGDLLQGSLKVNTDGVDLSHKIPLLNRPTFSTINPVDRVSSGSPFEAGFPKTFSTTVYIAVDKSVIPAVTHCFGGTNLESITITEVGTAGAGPSVMTERILSNIYIESCQIEFDQNYQLATSEGIFETLTFAYSQLEETRTHYGEDMTAEGQSGVISSTDKGTYEPA